MILSSSGGLVYHARAAFTRFESLFRCAIDDRWQPTRRSVSSNVRAWLTETQPQQLIIFGPSAGYLLEPDFFAKLDRELGRQPISIVAVDPDPLAQIFFRRRFRSTKVTWHTRSDLLPFTSRDSASFGAFIAKSLKENDQTAILFLGLLGQVALFESNGRRSMAEARRLFLRELKGLNWASLHDLESTVLNQNIRRLPPALCDAISLESIVTESQGQQIDRIDLISRELKAAPGPPSEWTDHETDWLGPTEVVIPWSLSPRRLHILGWMRDSRRPTRSPSKP